jgi:hypothetical protein
MSPIAVIILIIVILVVIAAVAWGVQASRRKKLQSTFGPEYDRVVADTGSRSDAEKELRDREKRHAELELKPLSAESQVRYATSWEEVQIQFVDNPEQAVTTADDLVTRLIAERGYPTGDYDDQLANLSVEHARTLSHYRDAHEISTRSANGEASTEDLRQALVHYRALFADLLGTEPVKTDDLPGTPTALWTQRRRAPRSRRTMWPVVPLSAPTTTPTPTAPPSPAPARPPTPPNPNPALRGPAPTPRTARSHPTCASSPTTATTPETSRTSTCRPATNR